VQIGVIASERQAINACLRSLSVEDSRFQPLADKYWVARGGSYTDGGAFALTVSRSERGCHLCVQDKFGKVIVTPRASWPTSPKNDADWTGRLCDTISNSSRNDVDKWFAEAKESLTMADLAQISAWLDWLANSTGKDDAKISSALDALTLVRDRRYNTGIKKRSTLLALVDKTLYQILRALPGLEDGGGTHYRRVDFTTRQTLRSPLQGEGEEVLVVDACAFPAQGEESAARLLCRAYSLGWRRFIAFDWRGGRFAGCGLGPNTEEVRLDIYGDAGDYLGSGLEGAQVYVHGDAQDQVGQILKAGRLVVHGDVGQTFLYGAKGGEIYVLGSAAGRPLINAVGRPRVVINGTCLDYLAESFMAGDPFHGGGFAIINGMTFDETGRLIELDTPYPGGNLFSLASGGAIYLRDPHGKVVEDQLNGGQFAPMSDEDWQLIEPYLHQNELLFGVQVCELLKVDDEMLRPSQVYRKVEVRSLAVLH
jgi:hypothetical protein